MSAPELTEVRSPMNLDQLCTYLSNVSKQTGETHIGEQACIPRSLKIIKQFKFGQSNPTYYFEDESGRSFVLRRKPTQNAKLISRSAHAIEREFFILNGINVLNQDMKLKIPVPHVHLLCEDESVIGYVFYIMDYVPGMQIKNPSLPGIPQNSPDRTTIWKSIIETIAAIHLLDVEKLITLLPPRLFPQFQNLPKLRESSYFSRQIKTLKGIHHKQSQHVDAIPNFDKITQWLLVKAPKDPAKLTLIHGDFKIDNVLFDPKTKKVCGVLDWELCTVGNPLFDLSNFLQPFAIPNKLNLMFFYPQKTDMGNENKSSRDFLHAQLVNYTKLVKWDPNDPKNNPIDLWPIGHTFGLLRLCVISQGIAMRVKLGNASSAQAEGYAGMYPYLSELAMENVNLDHAESKI
ncbi:hypothetical protein KGF56_004913 [Candida oxycetoniae]|uniref:Protein kinase domain-containing protein n=1 Tax=Candida oxycetoniae TaxID=497107 RepID=A0AAI9SSD6_9ASCO|nr:uncharacterized protein KGF56_004913 [Candida oxycetoniae]KAI3402343.2 hypothetical protein KGF56_004913 [Candida oxycetoniae]